MIKYNQFIYLAVLYPLGGWRAESTVPSASENPAFHLQGIHMYDLEAFYGPNAGYVLELYERYRQNPVSVDAATRAIFDTWSPENQLTAGQEAATGIAPVEVSKIVAASALAHAIRSRGHLGAHLDPLGR